VNLQLWNWRGLDVVNAHERDPKVYVEGLRAGVAALTEGVLDLRRLCTHSFPLEELPRAFETMARRPEGFLKALVVP
jgi:threonine dehydrogenase-like Zn-dependent dehydrogenase